MTRFILSFLASLIFLTSYSQVFIKTEYNASGIKLSYNVPGVKTPYNSGSTAPPPPVGRISGTFPYTKDYAYHNAASNWGGLDYFFNGSTTSVSTGVSFGTNWVFVDSSTFNFLFPVQSQMRLKTIRIFDSNGSESDPTKYTKFWGVRPDNSKFLIGTHNFVPFNQWVNIQLADSTNVIAVEMQVFRPSATVVLPTEIQFLGSWIPYQQPAYIKPKTTFKNHLGENSYWYNYQNPTTVNSKTVDSVRFKIATDIQGNTRLYTDMSNWCAVDPKLNNGLFFTPEYTHNNGGANYDTILYHLRQKGTDVILDVKDLTSYMQATFPTAPRTDFIPVRYNAANWPQMLSDPMSYMDVAMLNTQLAIRYGRNTSVNPSYTRIYPASITPWNPSLSVNTIKIGLDYVDVLEIGNELNKYWAVPARTSYLAPEEYAALLSAVYDGHKGTMGDTVGVKTFDPTMKVAIMGMVGFNPGYILGMVNWSRVHRGLRVDGSVDVPWDIIKGHQYFSDIGAEQSSTRTRGAAPETVDLDSIMSKMMRATYPHFMGVNEQWPLMIGESGYDVANTIQQARQMLWVGKGRVNTQADWLVRSMLIFMRGGIASTQFYQLADDGNAMYYNKPQGILDTVTFQTNYYSSGIITRREDANPPVKKPAAWAFQQILSKWGNWEYDTTISGPYVLGRTDTLDPNFNGDTAFHFRIRRGDSTARVLWLGTESGFSQNYDFFSDSSHVQVWTYNYDTSIAHIDTIPVIGGKATIPISERPVWVTQFNDETGPPPTYSPLVKYTLNMGPGAKGYVEWLPNDYASNPSKRYPLIVFIPGSSETGNGSSADLEKVMTHGPLKHVKNGTFPASFTVNSQEYKFIVIGLQFNSSFIPYGNVKPAIDTILNRYRVDTSRIYLTGLSAGGGAMLNYITGNSLETSRIAATAVMSASQGASPITQARADTAANGGAQFWSFHNNNDPTTTYSNLLNFVNYYNSSAFNKGITAKLTTFASSSHDAWTGPYNPANQYGGESVYEWFLKQSRSQDILEITLSSQDNPTITPAVLPYNKAAALFMDWDDNSSSAITHGRAYMDTMTYTTGTGQTRNYAGMLAVNLRRVFSNAEIGYANEPGRVQYSQMPGLISFGWEIVNHGRLHDPSGNYNYINQGIGADTAAKVRYNLTTLNDTIYLRLGYRIRGVIAPSNYLYTGSQAKTIPNMLYTCGQSDQTFLPDVLPVPRVNKPGTYGPMPGYFENITPFGGFYRDFTDGWASSLTSYKAKVDDLVVGNSSSVHKFWRVGTHGVATSDTAAWREFIQYVQFKAANNVFVGSAREAMEHRELGQLPRTVTYSGNKVIVRIDQATMNPHVFYKNLTLLLNTTSNITDVKYKGVSVPFNNTTKQINITL